MPKPAYQDTIAAIATPVGVAGIGIVRISGKDSLSIADKLFIAKDKSKPSTFKTYTTHYGWIAERKGEAGERIVDEVILTVMRSPKSYTKEDVVEINCHGGIIPLRMTLELTLENGCRLAEPGEFTRRAFLNGRIDLIQAEAVLDVIRAKTDLAMRLGSRQLKGELSQKINKIRENLLVVLSSLEANIDFPEEENAGVDFKKSILSLKDTAGILDNILKNYRQGQILREGIQAVICGKPNVGKSSLLNALLKKERSIVTAIPGTTRDTIEEIIDIKGIPVRIVDTAGIIEPRDLIEKKAVARSKKYIELSDIAILLFDGSSKLDGKDELLIAKLKKKPSIAVINKIDLRQRINKEKIRGKFHGIVEVSAKKSRNLGSLEDAIVNLVYKGKIPDAEPGLIAKLRHIVILKQVQKQIEEVAVSLDNELSVEFIAQGIKDAFVLLDRLLGRNFSQELLDKIFHEFCIGK